MTWDMSSPPTPKQRRITPETLRRQKFAAHNARQEADAIAAGRPPPPPITSRPARQRAEPREVPVAEHAELWAFAGTQEGRAIDQHLRHANPINQLRLLRARRKCVRNEPYAWDGWVKLLLEMGSM